MSFSSVSYMPVTQSGSYDVPVMARRDLHGDYRGYNSSNFHGGVSTLMSTPGRIISNVKSQITNGYSVLRDRFARQSTEQQNGGGGSLINSSFAAHRDSRSSSQSSSNRSKLRRGDTPVHSTPRDVDSEHSKTSSKQRKHRQSQDDQQDDSDKDSLLIRLVKRIFHAPIDILSFFFRKFFGIPWWLLLPLLLFLGFYACKLILVCEDFIVFHSF